MKGTHRVLVRKNECRGHLEDLGVGWKKILKWVIKKCDGDMETIHLAQDTRHVTGCCENDNEPLGFLKYGEFLDFLRNAWLLCKYWLS